MAFPDGWGRKVKITIPDAQIDGSNTNFPVLLTESEFPTEMLDGGANSALNGGGDVRFSEDAAGSTRLDLDIVTFVTGGTPDVELHAKLPTVNTGAAKEFYAWYKKTAETQPAVTAAFGRNAVWADEGLAIHMSSATPIDSTGNHTVNINGGPLVHTGDAIDFDGTNDWLGIASAANLLVSSAMTMTRRFTPSGSDNDFLFWKRGGGSFNGWAFVYDNVAKVLQYTNFGVADFFSIPTGTLTGEQHVTCTQDGTTLKFYLNGTQLGSDITTGSRNTSSGQLRIASRQNANTDTTDDYSGHIDFGARYSNSIVRSADWVSTEFNNQNAPGTFASAGTPEAVDGVTTRRYSLSLTGVG